MKTIIIFGGSGGLGKSIAEKLSENNNVVIVARNEKLLKEISKTNKCDYCVCDVSNSKKVKEVFRKVENKYKKIDAVINSAGTICRGKVDFMTDKQIEDCINVNLIGAVNITKEILPFMKKNNSGQIIQINSFGGVKFEKEKSVYNASKWGLTGFSKCIVEELKDTKIRYTNLIPGFMNTDIFEKHNIPHTKENALDTKEVAKIVDFIINLPESVNITEIHVKNTNY